MNKTKQLTYIGVLFLILVFLVSCATTGKKRTGKLTILDKGISAWNKQKPEAARHYWSQLKDIKQRLAYIGYIDQYKKTTTDLDDIVASPPKKESKYLSAYRTLHKTYASFPATLIVPKKTAKKMAVMASGRTRALLDKNKIDMAQKIITQATELYGQTKQTKPLLTEIEILTEYKNTEKAIDSNIRKTRSIENFYDKIDGYERVIISIRKDREELKKRADDADLEESKPIAYIDSRLKKKSQRVRLEMKRTLRERQYSFKDRIGEEFARVPEGGKLGSMSLKETLAFQKEIKSNIETAYKEMEAFNRRYPSVIDKKMLRQVEAQKKTLDGKIAQVEREIRTARDIASRGRPVFPLMIGLFNPEKGGKKGNKKSRPAHLRGTIKGNSHYWWGMVSIPKKKLNDLVITMKDNRPIKVFGENTKSGRRIKNLGDLVNRSYKTGYSWPVLNAGNQLPSGKYYIVVPKGTKLKYEGEAVIYSSFITRMR
ncbi:MAG: hypothetical protein KAW12_15295 [Candidatus Aminicenantes bacterium]|nr:hypothetical protein [Candidatus Aminicenantes bacterium]